MPTRYLKPGIRDSEAIDGLSPAAEVLFYRLIVTVDDFGRTDARPAMIKAACFPVKESATAAKCQTWLEELAQCGVIDLYTADGKPYLQMRKWENIPRAKESRFPAMSVPADNCVQLHTDARSLRTVLPVTGTGTGTERAQRKRSATPEVSKPDGVSEQVWADWMALRARKRAPVTETVVEGAVEEAGKAGMTLEAFLKVWCRRGSQGLEAAWLRDEKPAQAKRETWERFYPDEKSIESSSN